MAKQVTFAMRCRSLRKIKGLTQEKLEYKRLLVKAAIKMGKGLRWFEATTKHRGVDSLSRALRSANPCAGGLRLSEKEEGHLGALEHFVDIDLLPPDKIELLKNLYDSFQQDLTKKIKRKDDADNGQEV